MNRLCSSYHKERVAQLHYIHLNHHMSPSVFHSLLTKRHRNRKRRRSLVGKRQNQMVKRRRCRNSRIKRLKVPKVPKCAENRSCRIRHALAIIIDALLLHEAGLDPRRNEEGGNPSTEPVKLVCISLPVGRLLGVCQIVRTGCKRRRNVVVETTALIVCDNEERVFPLRGGTEGVINVLDESFAVGDEAAVMHGVCADPTARWVDVRELGEASIGGVRVELCQGDDLALVARFLGPAKPVRFGACATGGVPVVEPGVVGLAQLLEDGALGECKGTEGIIVLAMAGRCAGNQGKAVGVCRLISCQLVV